MNEKPITVEVPGIVGLELIAGVQCFRGIQVAQMRAWPVHLAARICGVSGRTFEKDVAAGTLRVSRHGVVSAVELERYLAARVV